MSEVKVYTLHLKDGYFLETDMGGDLGKYVIGAVPKSDYDTLSALVKSLEVEVRILREQRDEAFYAICCDKGSVEADQGALRFLKAIKDKELAAEIQATKKAGD